MLSVMFILISVFRCIALQKHLFRIMKFHVNAINDKSKFETSKNNVVEDLFLFLFWVLQCVVCGVLKNVVDCRICAMFRQRCKKLYALF